MELRHGRKQRGRPRKNRAMKQYSLYLTANMDAEVRALAAERGISRNAMLVRLLTTGLETTRQEAANPDAREDQPHGNV